MSDTNLEPIVVGDFELSPGELFSIARAYVSGESAAAIAERLDLDLDDLVELLDHPEIFDRAVTARKNLIRLLVYGPLVDRLITIATGSGDSRSQVSAIKFLRELAEDTKEGDKAKAQIAPTVTHNTLNVIGQLPPGGFDSVIRQVEAAQEVNILDVTPVGGVR